MSTTNDGWIRMDERLPDEGQLQIFMLWEDNTVKISGRRGDESWRRYAEIMGVKVRGWKPIEYPPPPREPTQQERDEAAFNDWRINASPCLKSLEVAWDEALAYERREVLKLLPPQFDGLDQSPSYQAAVKAIRARCTP